MAQAVIAGGRILQWDRHTDGERKAAEAPGLAFFKPMVDMMVEMSMLEVLARQLRMCIYSPVTVQ